MSAGIANGQTGPRREPLTCERLLVRGFIFPLGPAWPGPLCPISPGSHHSLTLVLSSKPSKPHSHHPKRSFPSVAWGPSAWWEHGAPQDMPCWDRRGTGRRVSVLTASFCRSPGTPRSLSVATQPHVPVRAPLRPWAELGVWCYFLPCFLKSLPIKGLHFALKCPHSFLKNVHIKCMII